mmetsp:Transcript_2556/g.9688  ORF Transcript_2556/g.9688 Transcript_2556/m.9688 type:complete len:82 (-) Transcript_2556:3178-3423(-)
MLFHRNSENTHSRVQVTRVPTTQAWLPLLSRLFFRTTTLHLHASPLSFSTAISAISNPLTSLVKFSNESPRSSLHTQKVFA